MLHVGYISMVFQISILRYFYNALKNVLLLVKKIIYII